MKKNFAKMNYRQEQVSGNTVSSTCQKECEKKIKILYIYPT